MTRALYHAYDCPFSRRTRFAFAYLGFDADQVAVPKDDPPRWFVQTVDRAGTVPVLVEDGEPLTESSLICEYADERKGRVLSSADPWERAQMRRAVARCDSEWMPVHHDYEGALGRGATARTVIQKRATLTTALEAFEDVLRERGGPFVMGADLTLADVAYASTVPRVHGKMPTLFRSLDAVAAWVEAISLEPAWRAVETRTLARSA